MSAYPDDFDEAADDDAAAPLLPADDRIWRHPSEISATSVAFGLDPVAVRRRWLASEPSRASAWTAGVVGAILATGLVVLGTRLATALTERTNSATSSSTGPSIATSPVFSPDANLDPVRALLPFGFSAGMTRAVDRVSQAMALVGAVLPNGRTVTSLSFIVSSNGVLVAPAASVVGATSIEVTLANGATYTGAVMAVDGTPRAQGSGLALLTIQATGLTAMRFDARPPDASGGIAAAVELVGPAKSIHGAVYLDTVRALDVAGSGGPWPLVDTMTVDLPPADVLPGTALVDDSGGAMAIVTGARAGTVEAVPSWLVAPVVTELLAKGKVSHGWLGIDGSTALSPSGVADGALVGDVIRRGAAQRAGLHRGDVIVAIGPHRVRSIHALMGRLYLMAAGHKVTLTVERGTRTMHVLAQLGARSRA